MRDAAGKHIYVKELHSNIVGSLSIPRYVHIHQSNSTVVRREYIEVQEIDQVSYRSLHTVKAGKKWVPIRVFFFDLKPMQNVSFGNF